MHDKLRQKLAYDVRRGLFALCKSRQFRQWQKYRRVDAKTWRHQSLSAFDRRRCIFVRVPKTASISISTALFNSRGGMHLRARDYQIVFSRRDFYAYFKFAFVRNPWDRLFSAYNFLRAGGLTQEDKEWAAAHINPQASFLDFVERSLARPHVQNYLHFIPQHHFGLGYDGRWALDFLGYFENLEEDFEYVKNKLQFGAQTVLLNINQSRAAPGEKLDYRDAYSDKARRLVADVYQKDIEIFGYAFDNASLKTQIKNRPRAGRRV